MDNLVPLPIDDIADESATDFDLYLKAPTAVILYAPATYLWTRAEIGRLTRDGHGTLYYSNSDKTKVEAYAEVAQLPQIDKSADPRIKISELTEVGKELTRILYTYPLTESSLTKVKQVATDMVDTIKEDPACVIALGLLANHDYYTYYHSARVAAYSVAVALEMSQTDQKGLEELAIGCLLHDVGKSKVPAEVIRKPGKLTDDEWETMKLHTVFGSDLIKEGLVSVVPREIVLHHHERIDGKGYPHGIGKPELYPEVKIASFADVFDALTTNRSYQPSRSRFEALDLIRQRLLDGLDKEAFRAMVSLLERGREWTEIGA